MRQDTYGIKTCQACGHTDTVIVSSRLTCDVCGKMVDGEKANEWVKCDVFHAENSAESADERAFNTDAEGVHEVDFCGYECYLKWLAAASGRSGIDFIAPGVILARNIGLAVEGMRRFFAEMATAAPKGE